MCQQIFMMHVHFRLSEAFPKLSSQCFDLAFVSLIPTARAKTRVPPEEIPVWYDFLCWSWTSLLRCTVYSPVFALMTCTKQSSGPPSVTFSCSYPLSLPPLLSVLLLPLLFLRSLQSSPLSLKRYEMMQKRSLLLSGSVAISKARHLLNTRPHQRERLGS